MLKFIMHLKAVTTNRDGTNGRVGGCSESHYLDGDVWTNALEKRALEICDLRAALLPGNASVYGQTFAFILDNKKPSYTYDRRYPGKAAVKNDIPQLGLKLTMNSGTVNNRKEMKLAMVPDVQAKDGEYANLDDYNTLIDAYCKGLVSRGMGFRGLKQDAVFGDVMQIAGNGAVNFVSGVNPVGIANGATVRFLQARTTAGKAVTGSARVRIAEGVFYIDGWSADGVTRFRTGRVMLNTKIFCPYFWPGIAAEEPQICVRKVGRPRDLYVGRRSK